MSFRRQTVSESTATRLSIYLRGLGLLETEKITRVSSQAFGRRFDLSPAQIRKDLATFGEFGVRGVGYEVSVLKKHLVSILGLDRTRRLAIVGAGRLGQALADSPGFMSAGFAVTALFDNDPNKIGTRTRAGVPVHDVARLAEVVRRDSIVLGVLTVPACAASEVARRCFEAKLRGILNFAPVRLNAPPGVRLKNVDLKIPLETLSFYIQRP